MKKIIKYLFKRLGFRIVRESANQRKTSYSKDLSFYKTKTGHYYLPKNAHSDIVVQSIIRDQIFDEPIVSTALDYVKKGTTILDIGSNFGQMAILFSNAVGETGTVHAFDADDFIFSILQKNIIANNKENIISHFGAVHNINDITLYFPIQDFNRFESYGSYGIDFKNKKGRPVKTFTIDSLNLTEPISFMKVDVQGGDLYAMQGAVETIKRNKMPILFEYESLFEEDTKIKFQHYVDFVNEINYKFEKIVNGQNFLIIPK
jgi:FkbM family methyltransferase